MMASNDEVLDLIEKRIAAIENKISDKQNVAPVKIIETLVTLHNKLQSLVTGREKITAVFSRLDEVEKYMDPEFAESLTLPDHAKLEYVLASEDKIRDAVASLQTIKDLEPYINTEHVRETPYLVPKLQKINLAQLELIEKVDAFSDETKRLVDQYNTLVGFLSEKFVIMDAILTEMEEQNENQTRDSAERDSPRVLPVSRLHWFENEF